MAEWFKATVLKTVVLKGTVSSNLTLSAKKHPTIVRCFLFDIGFSSFTPLRTFPTRPKKLYRVIVDRRKAVASLFHL